MKHRNRVIFRDTNSYRFYPQDLILEEIRQLERGDLPYFFKKMNSSNVFYLSDENKIEVVSHLSDKMKKISSIIGQTPEVILSENRMKNKLFPMGVLGLISIFKKNLKDLSYLEVVDAEIFITEKKIILKSDKIFELNI